VSPKRSGDFESPSRDQPSLPRLQTAATNTQLTLRPLTAADFPLLLAWLAKPHVKAWWDDGDDTLEKVAHHYGKQSATKERFILMLHDAVQGGEPRPIGYMQYEMDEQSCASIDQFIGEEGLLSQGIGTQAIRLLISYIMDHHQPRLITVDPHPTNHRAIRCYAKVGFQHDPALPAPEGLEAYMMKIAY
jgi:aminoglycoside 6'-N-acetyltransferase